MMKLTTIILFFVISFQSLACDESSINLISQTTNPDGSITYELNLYLDLGGSDVAHYGFTLSFLSSFNTPEVMAGGFDPLISQSDLTSGISDDLVGLIGDDVNSIANDSDWAPYENRTDVLSYESNGIFPSASTDYSMTIFVTVMGCVENIEFDSNTNSGNAACIYTANTGQVCDGCDVSSGNINIIGGTNVGPNEYDLSNCETISFSVTNENLNGGTLTYGWAIFSCEPNLPFNAAEISNFNNNPCYLGSDYGTSTSDIDAGGISGTIIGGYEQLWILPYTSDIADALDGNGDGCFDFADAIQVNYIPPTCGTCADPGCTSGSVNTFEDRTYLSCNNPCADLNNTTYITHHTVTTDAFGNVGVVQQINFSQFSCSELSRSAVLREAVNSCSGPDILPTITNANGVGSGFNPEWIGLNPNTNYTLIINTIIGSDCDYDFGCLDFYGIPGCSANAGVTDIITSNTSNSDYVLCFNETIDLTTTNYTLPNVSANSSMGYALYNCEPTTNDPATDVCFTGQYVIGDAANSVNNGTFAPAIAAPNQTVWLVPITMDMATPPVFNHDSDEDGCFALGAPIEISYLNPITASNINDCNSGSVTISINGGYPEFFSGSYNLVNLGSGTLSNTTVGNSGGTVDLTNLNNGDLIELSITDNNGCQEIFTSTFTCFECGNCNTPDCLIAGAYPDYETAADPMNQCSQINLMASNPVNDGVFTSYHQVVSSPDGTLGVIITSGVNDVGAGSCTVNRLANLYPINGPCTIGTGIVPIPPAQGWLPIYNPEFTGLTPNTTYILQVTFTVPLGCELVDHCESYYYPEICQITDISGVILNCDPVDNTYSAEVTVSYSSNPENGTLDIYMPDSHSFAITTSPQTLVIDGLSADGQMVDVSAAFSDENSCSSTALDLFEAPSIQDCGIIIPTAFTPDGDNVNDFWSLENIDEIYPNNKVFIYNRWGNIIFESQAGSYEQYPWSGTFNGEKLPVGSFYYIIDYNDGYTDTSNGTVSILK
jgi:gliding motility-associated-like protein